VAVDMTNIQAEFAQMAVCKYSRNNRCVHFHADVVRLVSQIYATPSSNRSLSDKEPPQLKI
jgi:hypothetical protein